MFPKVLLLQAKCHHFLKPTSSENSFQSSTYGLLVNSGSLYGYFKVEGIITGQMLYTFLELGSKRSPFQVLEHHWFLLICNLLRALLLIIYSGTLSGMKVKLSSLKFLHNNIFFESLFRIKWVQFFSLPIRMGGILNYSEPQSFFPF